MKLEQALAEITEIRSQIARTETFRGFRSLTVAMSGVLGLAGAFYQASVTPPSGHELEAYLRIWSSVAALNLLIVAAELGWHYAYVASPLNRRLTLLAVQQFLPCVGAGALVTLVIGTTAPECGWMFPGLWAVIFSLGVFASCRLLPRLTFLSGLFYLLAGCLCLSLGPGPWALSPVLMGGTFGCGQLFTAGILYWTLERPHEPA